MTDSDLYRPSTARTPSVIRSIRDHTLLLFTLLGIMWAVEIVDVLPGVYLDELGLIPRSISGLRGILFAPFLHGGFGHLIANSLPFLILGGIVLLGGLRIFWSVTLFVMVAGGLGVWLFAGPHTIHIGASGLIFGYLGFLLARGLFEGSPVWIMVSVVILVLYGGMLMGVFPLERGISWQSHLFGFAAGIIAARLLFSRERKLLT